MTDEVTEHPHMNKHCRLLRLPSLLSAGELRLWFALIFSLFKLVMSEISDRQASSISHISTFNHVEELPVG